MLGASKHPTSMRGGASPAFDRSEISERFRPRSMHFDVDDGCEGKSALLERLSSRAQSDIDRIAQQRTAIRRSARADELLELTLDMRQLGV